MHSSITVSLRQLNKNIIVNTEAESIRFYHNIIGLGIVSQFEAEPDMKIAMLGEPGNVLIELIEQNGISQESKGLSIGFEVPSIEGAIVLHLAGLM